MNIKNLLLNVVLFSLISTLVACGGSGGDTAITDEYKVEFIPDTMPVKEGKSSFQLRITNLLTGQPAENLDVSLMPMMYMATHEHSTPYEGVTEAGNGLYDATVYYLMPSSMKDGTPMGYWDIEVMIGGMMGEVAHFYPDVMMAMGDTPKVVLKGQNPGDVIPGMLGDESRSYYIFKESLTGIDNNHTFNMFLAAKESMMSYPAIDDGVTLNPVTPYELTVALELDAVQVSTDGSTWVNAVNNGSGHFSAAGLTGMSSGIEANIHVKVKVNGEQKTTNGGADPDTDKDFATFTVTP